MPFDRDDPWRSYRDRMSDYLLNMESSSSDERYVQQGELVSALSEFLSLTNSAYVYNPPYLIKQYENFLVFAKKTYKKHQDLGDVVAALLQCENVCKVIKDAKERKYDLTLSINNLWSCSLVEALFDSKAKHTLMSRFSMADWQRKSTEDIYTLCLSDSSFQCVYAVDRRSCNESENVTSGNASTNEAETAVKLNVIQEGFVIISDALHAVLLTDNQKGVVLNGETIA